MLRLFKRAKEQEMNELLIDGKINPEVLDHLNAVVQLDTNGNVISFNQVFAKRYGYSDQDFKKPFFYIFIK